MDKNNENTTKDYNTDKYSYRYEGKGSSDYRLRDSSKVAKPKSPALKKLLTVFVIFYFLSGVVRGVVRAYTKGDIMQGVVIFLANTFFLLAVIIIAVAYFKIRKKMKGYY